MKWDGTRIKYGVVFLGIVIFIFYLSGIPHLHSGFPDGFDQILRKAVHVVIFAVLTFSLWKSLIGFNPGNLSRIILCIILTMIIAGCNEVYQINVPGRSGDIFGFAFDCIGIALGLAIPNVIGRKVICANCFTDGDKGPSGYRPLR